MNAWLLAETAGNDATITITEEPAGEQMITSTGEPNMPTTPAPAARPAWQSFVPLILLLVVMYFFLFRGPKKREKQHQQMLQGLEKNDKVRTIGGIIGTVVDVRGDEIVLKIDEANNVKIRIAASAVGRKLSKDTE